MRERKEDMNKDNDAWGVQDEWENEAQTKAKYLKNTMLQSIKKKHDMLRMMEQDINQSMT